jgi:hypothetical protein
MVPPSGVRSFVFTRRFIATGPCDGLATASVPGVVHSVGVSSVSPDDAPGLAAMMTDDLVRCARFEF